MRNGLGSLNRIGTVDRALRNAIPIASPDPNFEPAILCGADHVACASVWHKPFKFREELHQIICDVNHFNSPCFGFRVVDQLACSEPCVGQRISSDDLAEI
jgi:hypothetical protein